MAVLGCRSFVLENNAQKLQEIQILYIEQCKEVQSLVIQDTFMTTT